MKDSKRVFALLLVVLLGIAALTGAQDEIGEFTITLTHGTSITKTIELVQDITELPLADAKALVDAVPDSIILQDVSREIALSAKTQLEAIGAIVAVQGGELVEESSLEGDNYQLVLISVGDSTSKVATVLRSLTSMSLAEALSITRTTSEKIILDGVSQDIAESAQEQFAAAGATVEVRLKAVVTDASNQTGTGYKVTLNTVGDDLDAVIKAVESFTNLPTGGTADLVAQAPDVVVLSGATLADATRLRKALTEAGATASVQKQ